MHRELGSIVPSIMLQSNVYFVLFCVLYQHVVCSTSLGHLILMVMHLLIRIVSQLSNRKRIPRLLKRKCANQLYQKFCAIVVKLQVAFFRVSEQKNYAQVSANAQEEEILFQVLDDSTHSYTGKNPLNTFIL